MLCPGAVRSAAVLVAAACLVNASNISAEEPAPPYVASAAPTAEITAMRSQLQELRAAVADMRAEISAARAEAAALRDELRHARQDFAGGSQGGLRNGGVTYTATTVPAAAQITSPRPAREDTSGSDGPIDRVSMLEETQQLLDSKLATQYQTKVESASKYRVRLSGLALFNLSNTRGSVDNIDAPQLARPDTALDSAGSIAATIRQSLLGVEVFGPTIAGARTGGDLQFDFFGGFPSTIDAVVAGLVRLRTGRVTFEWPRATIVAGQDIPLFSPLSPTSLASTAHPAFSYAGNLWTWTPQVRLERRFTVTEDTSLGFQAGIMDPLTGELPTSQSYRSPQAGERSRIPAIAARTSWSRAAFGRNAAVGAGGYYARQNWGYDRTVDAWAATADWEVPVGPLFAISGEVYRGRGIGGLGGATARSVLYSGILADPRTSVVGLDTAGGWTQIKFRPADRLEFNVAAGTDVPFASDLRRFYAGQSYIYSSLWRNNNALANVIYQPRSNLLLSLEYRRIETYEATGGRSTADNVNISAGVLF